MFGQGAGCSRGLSPEKSDPPCAVLCWNDKTDFMCRPVAGKYRPACYDTPPESRQLGCAGMFVLGRLMHFDSAGHEDLATGLELGMVP